MGVDTEVVTTLDPCIGSPLQSVSVAKTDLIAKLGENIQVRRASILTLSPQWSNSSAVIATYIHGWEGACSKYRSLCCLP